MMEWENWSGSLKFSPAQFVTPDHEEYLRDIVARQSAKGGKIKLAAAGHSSSPLVETDGLLVHLNQMKGIKNIHHNGTATLYAGTTVHESNMLLQQHNLALFNTGDVDVQTLAGAISTGTHGSGRRLQNLAAVLKGVRMIDYKGDVHDFNDDKNADVMKAMRVSLGAFGIFTEITVAVVPLFQLHRTEMFTDTNTCVENFEQLANVNRNVDFYWYPRSDETKIRILNEPGKGTDQFHFSYYCRKDEAGNVGEILPKKRTLKFDEMEYALPWEAGLSCFEEVRKRVKARHRKNVAWRILVRSIAADENYLSPHQGRDSISISLHHNAGLPYEAYFNDIEPIFIAYGGRPHWAKKHNMRSTQLQKLYPRWNEFHALRKKIDPNGFYMNNHLKEVFEK
ncbi:D-arabinono-1,4-lactone oxidase [Pseudochryseolinea flava]|nr:D-arabinono-1,4-lactone oxidase [Pseudochryseolinea flava]